MYVLNPSAIFLLMTTLSLALGVQNASEFHCGSSEVDRSVAFDFIHDNCPAKKPMANECCVAHDDCYTKQLGQEHCDHVFCECLDVKVAEGAINGSCKSVSEWYCFTVAMFGGEAYAASAPKDMVPVKKNESEVTKPAAVLNHCGFDRPLSVAFYDAVSSHCPHHGDSFHSCCIQHNRCALSSNNSEECHADFCDCVESSVEQRGGQSCIFATQGFCRNSFSERTIFGSRSTYHFWSSSVHQYGFNLSEIVVLTIVFVVCIIAVSSALYCALGRLQKTLNKVSELEFVSPVYRHLTESERSV